MQITRLVKLIPVMVLALGLFACGQEAEKKPTPAAKPAAEAPKPAEPAKPATDTPKQAETPKPADEQVNYAADKLTLGKFSIETATSGGDGNNTEIKLGYGGKSIAQSSEKYREVKKKAEKDVPGDGRKTILVEMFTGGANCCFGYYLLTFGPEGKDAAAYIAPLDGSVGKAGALTPEGKTQAFSVNDPAFMYYEKASGEAKVSFIRPDSPRLERFIVFDNGSWRVDKKGEYAAAYKALLAKARENKEANPAARAITVAYYSLMAGNARDDVMKSFKEALPKEASAVGDAVFADIEKAVDGFSPVQNIALQ